MNINCNSRGSDNKSAAVAIRMEVRGCSLLLVTHAELGE